GNAKSGNSAKQQLQKINLVGVTGAAGTKVTVDAVKSPSGDGFANVGEVVATSVDLDAVFIDGDLGRVLAGDAVTSTSGLKGLTVRSLGHFGTGTGALDLHTQVQGKLAFLRVKGNIEQAQVEVEGGPDGDLGPVNIGGSLYGGDSDLSGRILA